MSKISDAAAVLREQAEFQSRLLTAQFGYRGGSQESSDIRRDAQADALADFAEAVSEALHRLAVMLEPLQ